MMFVCVCMWRGGGGGGGALPAVPDRNRGNDGKTTSKSGLALSGIPYPYYGKPRTARSGGSWL